MQARCVRDRKNRISFLQGVPQLRVLPSESVQTNLTLVAAGDPLEAEFLKACRLEIYHIDANGYLTRHFRITSA